MRDFTICHIVAWPTHHLMRLLHCTNFSVFPFDLEVLDLCSLRFVISVASYCVCVCVIFVLPHLSFVCFDFQRSLERDRSGAKKDTLPLILLRFNP